MRPYCKVIMNIFILPRFMPLTTFTTQHDLSLNISHYKYLYKTWNKPASLIMLPQSYPNQGCSIICVNEYDCERFAVTLNTVDSKYTSHWYDISIFHDGVSFRSNKSNKHNEMDHHCIIWSEMWLTGAETLLETQAASAMISWTVDDLKLLNGCGRCL